jgi:tetratricopeptide (TPR) repeat protein
MGTPARIDELRKKFEENPRRYFAPLANEYRKSGDLNQAILICQEYLPQQPGHMSGHIVYGQALYESDRREEAKAVFETALSLDPENLIALRHLGDIAHASGDSAGGREWYQRVLDADPRNEEIIQLLAAMESSSDSSSPEVAPAATASAPDHDTSALGATPSVEFPPELDEVARSPVAEQPEIEKSEEALSRGFGFAQHEEDESILGDLDDFELPSRPGSPPAPATATTGDHDLLDLDDFSLGNFGAEAPPPTPPKVAEESTPAGLDGDVTISGGFTLGTKQEQFEPDAFGVASPAPSPEIDLAADINLGLAEEPAPPSAADAEAMSLAGLETFEAGTLAGAPDNVPTLATEGFFDLPPVTEPPAPEPVAATPTVNESEFLDVGQEEHETAESAAASETPELADTMHEVAETVHAAAETLHEPPAVEATEEPVEAFVTETMAELYIQQGHLDSALDIYRKLVEQRPEEPELVERLRAIEDRIFGTHAVAEPDAAYPPPLPSSGGPTIREFLMGFLWRTPAGSGGGGPAMEQAVEPSDDAELPRRHARMTPGASETITGSIDALFSGASASDSDTAAADALAAAFAETAPDSASDPTSLDGTPAHRAQDELSLDHVFKASTPPRQSGATGFSFDQFFADEMADPAEESSTDAAPGAPEGTDDIAQFNAWLNGLKKT